MHRAHRVAERPSVCCGQREAGPPGGAGTLRAGGSGGQAGSPSLFLCVQAPRTPWGTGCPPAHPGPHQDLPPQPQPLLPSTSRFRGTRCRDCQSESPCQGQGGSCLTPWGPRSWGAVGVGMRVGELGAPGRPEHSRLSKPLAGQTHRVCGGGTEHSGRTTAGSLAPRDARTCGLGWEGPAWRSGPSVPLPPLVTCHW